MKRWFIFLSIFITPLSFAFLQQDLMILLQKPENIQGEFIQQRFLKTLPKPITTSGKFTLRKNYGLLWQMYKPFASDVRVTQKGIMQWNGSQWVENGRIGQSQQINLFLGLFSGDISALENQFTIDLSGNEKQWILALTPKSLLMKQIFTGITVQGNNVVTEIELYEKQGDRTRIELQKTQINQPLASFAQNAFE